MTACPSCHRNKKVNQIWPALREAVWASANGAVKQRKGLLRSEEVPTQAWNQPTWCSWGARACKNRHFGWEGLFPDFSDSGGAPLEGRPNEKSRHVLCSSVSGFVYKYTENMKILLTSRLQKQLQWYLFLLGGLARQPRLLLFTSKPCAGFKSGGRAVPGSRSWAC